jgi:hypothetical protein
MAARILGQLEKRINARKNPLPETAQAAGKRYLTADRKSWPFQGTHKSQNQCPAPAVPRGFSPGPDFTYRQGFCDYRL